MPLAPPLLDSSGPNNRWAVTWTAQSSRKSPNYDRSKARTGIWSKGLPAIVHKRGKFFLQLLLTICGTIPMIVDELPRNAKIDRIVRPIDPYSKQFAA